MKQKISTLVEGQGIEYAGQHTVTGDSEILKDGSIVVFLDDIPLRFTGDIEVEIR